jgi:hypothetical protein
MRTAAGFSSFYGATKNVIFVELTIILRDYEILRISAY